MSHDTQDMSHDTQTTALDLRAPPLRAYRWVGREFSADEVAEIARVVAEAARGTSRRQLAIRSCERVGWRRPTGALKWRECRDLLERLEHDGVLVLPPLQHGRARGARTPIPVTAAGDPGSPLIGTIGDFEPLSVEPVCQPRDHRLFRELVGRYHPLGYRVPFGASLRYLLFVGRPERAVVGAMQISSAAWRLAARDEWIGWDDATRAVHLQRVVNNSRFLVLPWIRIGHLASRALALLVRRLPADWEARYGVRPLLIETMVDVATHRGTCYRAANWRDLGLTAGRGRMDRAHARHGCAPKRVLVYPLVPHAAAALAGARS